MKTLPFISKSLLTILSVLILTACGAANHGTGTNSQAASSNWDKMVWDQGNWQ